MSVATKLTTINSQVAAAHGAVTAKGGTGRAGTSTLAAAINSIPAGGGGETVVPTVYAKLERILMRTPADAVVDYAGTWTRDSAWLALADVPMTFQSGSFGWTGTRALARYSKTVNGTTVYLYLYQLDGYYYGDTTAWDAVGVANAEQFFANIGTLGWVGELYMYYCFSTTDYTPAQVTSYNSVSGNTPFGSYSQAYAMSAPSPFTGPWDLLGLDDMGMGGSDILQTYSSKSSASLTLAVSMNWDNAYSWDQIKSNGQVIKNLNWGRLIDDNNISGKNYPDGDPITGTWTPFTGDVWWPADGIFKRREWKNETTGMYFAEMMGGPYSERGLMQANGSMFMQRPVPPDFSWCQGTDVSNVHYSWGACWFPHYRARSIVIVSGGTGYEIGDIIRVNYSLTQSWSLISGDYPEIYLHTHLRAINLVVTAVGENGAVTGVSDLCYFSLGASYNLGGGSSEDYWAGDTFLKDFPDGTVSPEAIPSSISASIIATNSTSGTEFACDIHGKVPGESMDYEPLFGGEREIYWLSSYGEDNANGAEYLPKIYELYKLTTSLSPIA